jgi:hypothetical protein
MNNWLHVYHTVCKQIAFYTTRHYYPGDVVRRVELIQLDGKHPDNCMVKNCGSCGGELSWETMTYEKPNR